VTLRGVGVEWKVIWIVLEAEGFWRIEVYDVRGRLKLEVWWTREGAVMTVVIQGCLVQTHRTQIETSKARESQIEVARQTPQVLSVNYGIKNAGESAVW
jgi:hypothetical protein